MAAHLAPEELVDDGYVEDLSAKAVGREAPCDLLERMQRAVIAAELREAAPADRLEDNVRQFVGCLDEIRAAATEHPADLLQVRITIRNVLEDIEAHDHVERSVRERQPRAVHALDRELAKPA